MPSSPSSWIPLLAALAVAAAVLLPAADARAFFIFGDSLVDNGNNNYLLTTARADSPPYGIDYPPTHRPTGRFSNGYNIPDLISQALGAESTLPYLSPELDGERLLVGANFASAGIGILNDTGVQFATIIRISQQIEFFREYQRRVAAMIGEDAMQSLVNGALVLSTLGGNDFVNNYFFSSYRRSQYNLQDFSVLLITEYRKILMTFYELGARRVLVTGTGPLGCVPSQLSQTRNGKCAPEPQRAAAIFNPLLLQMVTELNREVGSDVFISADAHAKQNDFIDYPQNFGFVSSKVACCGQGPFNGMGICNPTSNLCPDRNKYAFWDPFHPTEKACRLIVETMISGSEKYMFPMNLSTIIALDSRV